MLDRLAELFNPMFTWPTLPFTVLLLTMTLYWIVVSLGFLAFDAIDLDFDFDADLDVDAAAHASILDLGFLPLKWLNLGSVPLMIWGSVFTLTAWAVSRYLNAGAEHETFEWLADSQVILRDALIAAGITKVITNPLRGTFDFEEPNRSEKLIGRIVTVRTSEVTESFGEVEYTTDGAPLRMNARSLGPKIAKGQQARIIDYDSESKLYTIEPHSD